MTKLERLIFDSAPMQLLAAVMKKIIVPGTGKLSLYSISKFFYQEMDSNRLFDSCSAVTYNFVMAMPPTLLVLFSLVPYLPLQGVQATILETLHLIAPNENIYNSMSSVIVDFINNERSGVLSSGILLTLLFSSNGLMGLIRSFERQHLSVHVPRSDLMQRWTAIKMTVLLLIVALLSIAVLIIQSRALNEILLNLFDNLLLIRLVSIIVVLFIVFVAINIIYRYGPSLSQRAKFGSPGSVVATLLCFITSAVFFFLVNNFIHYNKVYGSIGTLMAFMLWIWLNTLVILIGYDLNVSVLVVKKNKEKNAEKKKEA